MTMQYPEHDINIVVNQANSEREGQRTYETLLKACQKFTTIKPGLLAASALQSYVLSITEYTLEESELDPPPQEVRFTAKGADTATKTPIFNKFFFTIF